MDAEQVAFEMLRDFWVYRVESDGEPEAQIWADFDRLTAGQPEAGRAKIRSAISEALERRTRGQQA
jgi:hypothetical protein